MLTVLIILRKKMDEVGQRQHQRKIKKLMTKVEQALWLFESSGVSTICVEDSHGNQSDISLERLVVKKCQSITCYQRPNVKVTYLYILDRFCVGNAAYHALFEEESGLPRSYLLKQCRSDINSSFTIRRTPGELLGAQISFCCGNLASWSSTASWDCIFAIDQLRDNQQYISNNFINTFRQ